MKQIETAFLIGRAVFLREAMRHAWTGSPVDAGSSLASGYRAGWTHTANAATATSCKAAK